MVLLLLEGDKLPSQEFRVCYYYSVSEQSWQKLPDMRTPRARASCAEIKNMVVMVVGGQSRKDGWIKVCEILDIKHGQWFPVAPLPEQFSSFAKICVAAGRIFILGNDVCLFEYDPVSDAFSKKASAPIDDHLIGTLTAVEDKMYVIHQEDPCVIVQYDSTIDQWTRVCSPSTFGSACNGTIAIAKGRNVVVCGRTDRGGGISGKRIEEFDTVTHQWKKLDICLPFGYNFVTSFVACVNV